MPSLATARQLPVHHLAQVTRNWISEASGIGVSDLVKSVMGGSWSLIIGWILPVFVTLQIISILVLPSIHHVTSINQFQHQSATARQVSLLAIAAVAGLVLAAAQAPLYRILEGYTLWPAKIAALRTERHRTRRRKLVELQASAAQTGRGVYAGLLYERAARYPANDKQFAPTTLGNAIRRFETYAGDRYQLDSQLLWHNLTAAAPPQAVNSVDQARTNVDFFVCLLYGGATTALLGLGALAIGPGALRPALAIAIGILIAFICYRLALIATDEWDAAVRAVVDHGRIGVASAFGLAVPANLVDERLMWRAVNTLVRRDYSYSEAKGVPAILQRFREPTPAGGSVLNTNGSSSAVARQAAQGGQPAGAEGGTSLPEQSSV